MNDAPRTPLVVLGRYLLVLAFLLTPLVTLRPGGAATFGDITLLLAACVALLVVISRRRLPDIPTWLWGGAGLLALSILLTVVLPPSTVEPLVKAYYPTPYTSSLETGIRLMIALLVLPLTAAVLADNSSTVRCAVWAWIAGVTASCLVATLDGVFGTNVQATFADNPEEVANWLKAIPARFVGLGVHPTSFSVTAVMAMPFLLAMMKSRRSFLLLSPALLVTCVALVLSASRVGYVGAVVVIALSLWLNPALRRLVFRPDFRIWVPLVLIAGISVFLFFDGPPALKQNDEGGTRPNNPAARVNNTTDAAEGSNSIRMEFVRKSIEFVGDRPFGGYGFEWIESAHSIYLQLLVSGGILALVGFFSVYLGYLRRGLNLRGRLPDDLEAIGAAAIAAMIAHLVMGIVQPDILDRYLYLPAGLIMALAAIQAARRSSDGETTAP